MIFVILPAVMAVIALAATRRLSHAILAFLAVFVYAWFELPILAYGFYDIPALILAVGGVLFALEIRRPAQHDNPTEAARLVGPMLLILLGLIVVSVIPAITTWSAFHSDKYHQLIGKVEEGNFSADTTPIDPSQARRVDQELAKQLAEKRLGEDVGLGSQVSVGTMNIQAVKGELWWVGPLNHHSIFKWWGSAGTPGYVMVSATTAQVRLVREVGGKPLALKYNGGACLLQDPQRYLYINGYATVGLTDWTFEIDDDGRPYWIVTKIDRKVGFSGDDATGVVVLDVQTGEIREFSILDAPAWIDRIQPDDIVEAQLNSWGSYGHGWWNSFLAQREVIHTTPGMSLVYGDDGRSYWYTGMQSAASDKGTVGFVLVHTRTKQAKMYRQAGASEDAAKKSAEGAVQQMRYLATEPILYNVSGDPTYFLALKDAAGLVKSFAFVSVQNYSVVGTGNTVQEALRNYRQLVTSYGKTVAPDTVVSRQKYTGKVLRVGHETTSSGTVFYLLVEGQAKLFATTSDLSPEVLVTMPGDTVAIEFEDGGNYIVDLATFDSMEITLQKSAIQAKVEERVERQK